MSSTVALDPIAADELDHLDPDEPGRRPTVPDFDRFVADLGDVLQIDLGRATRTTRLADDLGWDSLTMLEALAILDGYGVQLPDDLIGELRTLGDLHHYLRGLASDQPDRHR